jgi:myosin heavy subunit
MATNSPSPTPMSNPGSGQPDKSQQNFKIAAIAIMSVLAIVCAVLVFNLVSKNKANNDLTYELNESEQLKAELEKQYYEALSELEELRGSNEELNALIESQKAELKDSKDKIDALLRDSRNLKKARKEINGLTAQVEGYLAEINQLRQENEELTARTVELTEENTSLTSNLDSARVRNMELSSAKAALTSEKEILEEDRARLAQKVNIASVVKVSNVQAEGLKLRSNGKAVARKTAKNIDQLQICFQTTANQVTEPGVEQFFIRIINPTGETMAIEDLGSGMFTNNASGEQIRYTQIKETDYDRDQQNLCMQWSPNQPFQEGTYNVEVYNKGYLAGSTSFRLK